MAVSLVSRYLSWLQKDAPVGEVERYPELDEKGQTTLPGVYVVGDLTGIPLLKLAAEGGAQIVKRFAADADFLKAGESRPPGVKQVLILGGGPAGIAAAMECRARGLDYEVLESSQPFATIENFPKGKPILAKPDHFRNQGPLKIEDGTKESLLAALKEKLRGQELIVRIGERATAIRRRQGLIEVDTAQGAHRAVRVILAIGKSGDARRLQVPGEDMPHVYNRLFDPGDFHDQDIAVIGGGDSALEAAIALAESGNRVRLIYRRPQLERPKPENLERFHALAANGKIQAYFNAQPIAIRLEEIDVAQQSDGGPQNRTLPAQHVFALIGRELPVAFLRRSGIKLAGDKEAPTWIFLTAMLAFFTMLYCGKSGVDRHVFAGAEGWAGHVSAYLTAPFHVQLPFGLNHYAWYGSLNFVLGWLGSLVFLVSGGLSLGIMAKRRKRYFAFGWPLLKHGYLIAVAVGFSAVYFTYALTRDAGWSEGPTYWYSLFYTTTIALFGIRRILVRKTRYIRWQTLSLIFVQAFFLFYLPFYGYDQFIAPHFSPESYVRREMFPGGKWSSFGFVLFWPLNMGDFGKSAFWTWFPLVQTFGLLFLIVKRFGKGAYCGWICSCGGMAETLGDEVRHLTPHGKTPKRLENIGQFVLVFAVAVTALGYSLHYLPAAAHGPGALALITDTLRGGYKLSIDVFFAGVAGLGFYFFLGGRIWCRYGCPLAALMHIYSRFSVYRIVSEKKKCISCNACTKACHMGIDVMNYANKGIPLNDVECVRCSACVQTCPTDTLAFATLAKADTGNQARVEIPDYGKTDWRAGL